MLFYLGWQILAFSSLLLIWCHYNPVLIRQIKLSVSLWHWQCLWCNKEEWSASIWWRCCFPYWSSHQIFAWRQCQSKRCSFDWVGQQREKKKLWIQIALESHYMLLWKLLCVGQRCHKLYCVQYHVSVLVFWTRCVEIILIGALLLIIALTFTLLTEMLA